MSFKARCHAGWTFNGETGDCVNIPQVSHGGTISGRTCATALPCVERQGILWVYPSPDATDPPVENIAGEDLIVCSQCVPASSDTGPGQSVQLGASVESRSYPTLSWGLRRMAPCLSGLSTSAALDL